MNFLVTALGGFNRHPFLGVVLQILRYCSPNDLDFSEAKLGDLGLDWGWKRTVTRSYLGKTPRKCIIAVLVDAGTMPNVLTELETLTKVLPKDHAANKDTPVHTVLASHNIHTLPEHDATLERVQSHLKVAVQLHDAGGIADMELPRTVLRCMNFKADMKREAAWAGRFFYAYLQLQLPYVLSIDMDVLVMGNLDEMFGFIHDFNDQQVLGLGWEMIPTYTDNRFDPFHNACPKCHMGRWDGFPAVNGGFALLHLNHMRNSKRFAAAMGGNADAMCAAIKNFTGDVPMRWGDQDLYNFLAVVFPEFFYIYPCEWNYQLCTGFRNGPGDVSNGCPYKPKMYHGNCNTNFPYGDLGVTYSWGPGVRTHEVTDASALKPSAVGGPPINLTAVMDGRCNCIKPYA